ncbi:LrgB family protein [Niveibacterium terrae]|uniref:LrgB family protein n=1 Tax=Niveibacterium terrae TaxID=3373598 RepID=UPI003A8DC5CB
MKFLLSATFWLAATVLLYFLVRWLHRRWPRIWFSPLILVPGLLISALLLIHVPYTTYALRSHWLSMMLGPAVVAFALPIHEHRRVIARHWFALTVGVIVGMATAFASALAMAHVFNLPVALSNALAVRSISTPFAIVAAPELGGTADLAAVFVVLTGVVGMVIGDVLLRWLPVRSVVARGALFGAAAHAVGTVTAHRRDVQEGVVASLTMILSGIAMVLLSPVLASFIAR